MKFRKVIMFIDPSGRVKNTFNLMLPSVMMLCFLSRCHRELRSAANWGWGPRPGEARLEAAADPEEAARALLTGAGVRTRAQVQAAALPVRARAGAPGQFLKAHIHAGQNLVPEPALQVQAAAAGQDFGAGRPPSPRTAASQGSRARASAGREAVSGGLSEL